MRVKLGDVLFRFLPEYQVWHTGIVVRISNPDSVHNIYLLEFDDSDCIYQVSLYNFLWGRKYFWKTDFKEEMDRFGPGIFRPMRERIMTAYNLFNECKLRYTLHKYNCEYFVRRCVFNDSSLWPSKQTMPLGHSRIALYSKIATIVIFNIINKVYRDLEFEKNMRADEARFIVHQDGTYTQH